MCKTFPFNRLVTNIAHLHHTKYDHSNNFLHPNNKIYANGKVVVDSPASGTVTGDNGIYDLTKKFVTVSGHVVLHKQGQVTMQGSLLTVNMVTGIANLGATPVAGTANQVAAPGVPGGRVTGVITPKPQTGTP